jgi:hypothetical protein
MPNFDSGAYFLTALIPVSACTVNDGSAPTSAVHALRKEIAKIPTTQLTLAEAPSQSPFAGNTRNHLARLSVIEDVAYVGRDQPNALLVKAGQLLPGALAKKFNPVIAQPQDHLANPFMLFAVDFDAADGSDATRDSYLVELWDTGHERLSKIFKYCQDFEARVVDGPTFVKYIADCQIETTMPFHDYWPNIAPVAALPELSLPKTIGIALAVAIPVFLLLHAIGPAFLGLLWTLIALIAALAAGVAASVQYIIRFGQTPFPAATYAGETEPCATLPQVLKSLHLRRVFTRFAIDAQGFAAEPNDAEGAKKLYDAFGAFLQSEKPDDLSGPTQPPGVIGI